MKISKEFYNRGSEFVTVSVPYRTVSVPCPYRVRTVPYRVRTVPVTFSVFFYRTVFCAIATVTVPFFSLTVGSAKRTEPLILTVRILVFYREPYRTKMGTVIRLLLRTANRTAIRTIQIYNVYLYTVPILLRYGSRCGSRSSIIN